MNWDISQLDSVVKVCRSKFVFPPHIVKIFTTSHVDNMHVCVYMLYLCTALSVYTCIQTAQGGTMEIAIAV